MPRAEHKVVRAKHKVIVATPAYTAGACLRGATLPLDGASQ
jgi:hypothetical protein